jgi:transcriptional regulator with XRE-family HTH domain
MTDTPYRNEKIRGKMAELGFTIETLSQKTGISQKTITNVRNGLNTNVETLSAIAEALEIPMSELFTQRSVA